jgi:Rrf2 family protein
VKLHKASLLAIYAALELARAPDGQLSTADIAAKFGISSHHLAKVLRHMVRSGMVQAVRGVGGGYRFAGNPGRVTLLDVISLFEAQGSDLEVPAAINPSSRPVIEELQRIGDEVNELTKAVLDTVTLKTLLDSIGRRAAPAQRRRGAEG